MLHVVDIAQHERCDASLRDIEQETRGRSAEIAPRNDRVGWDRRAQLTDSSERDIGIRAIKGDDGRVNLAADDWQERGGAIGKMTHATAFPHGGAQSGKQEWRFGDARDFEAVHVAP